MLIERTAQWMGDFSSRYRAPENVTEKTRAEKNRIVMDTMIEESAKLLRLCKLCMTSKETFYIHVLFGCVKFEYVPGILSDSVRIRTGNEKIEEYANNRHVYHFNEKYEENYELRVEKTTFGPKLHYSAEEFKGRRFRILPVNPDLPYDSLVCENMYEYYFGTGNYQDYVKRAFINKFGHSLNRSNPSYTMAHGEFTKMCSVLNSQYHVAGALNCSKLVTIYHTNWMRDCLNDKLDPGGSLTCPDTMSGVANFYDRIKDLYENRELYNQLYIVSDDFMFADEKTQAQYIYNAYQLLKASDYKGTEYNNIYGKMKVLFGNGTDSEKKEAFVSLMKELYYKNVIDLYYEHFSFHHNGKVGDPANYNNRVKALPENIRKRNDKQILDILDKYGDIYRNSVTQQIKDNEKNLFFNYVHKNIHQGPYPKGANANLKEQRKKFSKENLMKEYEWDKKIRDREALINDYL